MRIYDRLYGEMIFPDIIQNLLDCPGLLRLRDVRMANNQFVSFPAFSNASRYEHSLGVCYLAGICAKSLNLSEKDKIELMMACLYHDVGTPPFAHAMEEVLQAEYEFDHENNLRQLIEGRNDSYVGNLEQIYMGNTVKLRSVCQSKAGRRLRLDIYRIAKLIVGDKSEPLSFLLNGNGMDLDNIDNIVRASTAMGIIDSKDCDLAKRLASSFIFNDKGEICYNALYMQDIRQWQRIRDEQYTAIFDSIEDFSYQTMIKKSLLLLINEPDLECQLNKDSWKLTDAEILHDYLLRNEKSASIMKRVLLNKPFHNLCILYIWGEKVSAFINEHLVSIEKIASDFYRDKMDECENKHKNGEVDNDKDDRQTEDNYDENNGVINLVVANFYSDKRKRLIRSDALMMGQTVPIDGDEDTSCQGALLGLFTPHTNYVTITNSDGVKVRKAFLFSSKELDEMIEKLQNDIFTDYEVSVYGKRKDKRDNKSITENQLGFF